MLVLSRKKHESILIDGVIRIEVVNVAKATVRVRLRAPRSLSVPHGLALHEARVREDPSTRTCPVGVDDFRMTLVNQQVVNLGESISLGVIDADKSRALFFVDAPLGISVTANKPQRIDQPGSCSRQHLLQFMSQPVEKQEENRGTPAPRPGVDRDREPEGESGPELLPFPTPQPKRHRLS
jgi:carbon storage regulator CsrA